MQIQCNSCCWWNHFKCSSIGRGLKEASHESFYFLCCTCQQNDNSYSCQNRLETSDGHCKKRKVEDESLQSKVEIISSSSSASSSMDKTSLAVIEPYVLSKLTNHIKICAGCRSKFNKPIVEPNDYVIRHRELDSFFDKSTKSMRNVFNNKYYHISANCLQAKNPNFLKSSICIPPSISLSEMHLQYFKKFGVDLYEFVNRHI